jgi:hypothetical protein
VLLLFVNNHVEPPRGFFTTLPSGLRSRYILGVVFESKVFVQSLEQCLLVVLSCLLSLLDHQVSFLPKHI